jgi:hypothetical protein
MVGNPSKFSVGSRRYATIWIAISFVWLYVGVQRIARHEIIGWFLCGFYALLALYYLYRLLRHSSSAIHETDPPESHNG